MLNPIWKDLIGIITAGVILEGGAGKASGQIIL
jgi:hypothetical protein